MRYLFTGGGTGGHVYPALAVAEEIRRRQPDAQFLYVGLRDRLEARVVPARGFPIRFVHARPYPRPMSAAALLLFCVWLGMGVLHALVILLQFRPQVIVGTGGYVSAPVLFAKGILSRLGLCRPRVFLYEPNAYPGMLNERLGGLADRIGLAFEEAARYFSAERVAVVGYPVRREVLEADRERARCHLHIPAAKRVVFVFGGSGGSRAINEGLLEALPLLRLRSDLLVLHVTGRYRGPDYDAVRDTGEGLRRLGLGGDTSAWYRRVDYMDDIENGYGAADLIVCRGGASTLTEVGLCGLPAIVVPLPLAAGDHQALNARELERRGAARVLYQEACWRGGTVHSRLPGQRLAAAILDLLDDEAQRLGMAETARQVPVKDSLGLILGELEGLVGGRRPPLLQLEIQPRPSAAPSDPNQLLRHVKGQVESAGGVGSLDPGLLSYLRYQADRLLASEAWYEIPLGRRNVGVKLVGLLQYREQLPLLLAILQDRTPVSAFRRLLGGDFVHPGLLRRNVIDQGIGPLGVATDEVRQALLAALNTDPYFEVRAAAARVLGRLFSPEPTTEATLTAALCDPAPAVVVEAIRALGALATRPEVLFSLQPFHLHADWRYRQELVGALTRLVERRVLAPEAVARDLERILATSPYFQPEFPLNEGIRRLAEVCRAAALEDRGPRTDGDTR
ncbi:MAG: glycosyltransferase [Candidatus Latescibacterota bacterium]